VLLKRLCLDEIRDILQILGALESATLRFVFDNITSDHIAEMDRLNHQMRLCLKEKSFEDFDAQYYSLSIAFHDVFLELSNNVNMKPLMVALKQRLYDFPRLAYIKAWEWANCDEHDRLIAHIRDGEKEAAAIFWQETHWGFEAQEPYIREYYAQANERIQKKFDRMA
jgi:DNA-binding GntR family transcriptional regulator